ncbi:hypothetical protein K438DRAFT_1790149 [Mycena galopus ATCC 62051]|nr:hypothetical protein K438DRAFT_1790149 [Mycena galopus ATCC 62051]
MPLLRHLDLTVLNNKLNAVVAFSPAGAVTRQEASRRRWLRRAADEAEEQKICRMCVHCELGIVSDWAASTDLPPEHGIELPCLDSLSLKNEDAPETVGYLDDFFVPALRSLQLEEIFLGTEPTNNEPTNNLASFISKSGCEPQQIHITNRILVSKASYRETFPSIPRFSFDEDSEAASIFAQSGSNLIHTALEIQMVSRRSSE